MNIQNYHPFNESVLNNENINVSMNKVNGNITKSKINC